MSETSALPPNKKARLGRGLGSLLGGMDITDESAPSVNNQNKQPTQGVTTPAPITAPAVATPPPPKIDELSQIWTIPIDRLVPNTQQPRQVFESEALKELTASIKEKGILQPITARRLSERSFEIIAGERRWRAAQLAGLHEVPVILKKVDEQNSLELAIIENIQRQDLSAMEEAEAYDRLMTEYKLTQQQVADKVGKERATVANTLRLLMLPKELQYMVKSGTLAPGHAKVILSVDDPQEQIRIAKRVVSDKLSVRATEQLVLQAKRESSAAEDKKASNAVSGLDLSKKLAAGLANELQKLIGTKVTIDYADSKGKLAIHFYSDEELNQITDKIREAWQK